MCPCAFWFGSSAPASLHERNTLGVAAGPSKMVDQLQLGS